jgi:Flp pilus assembly protein TadD
MMEQNPKARPCTAEDEVELRFLESVLQRRPEDPQILKALGDLYTRVGYIDKGLATDLLLARLCPEDATVWYNLACSQSLSGQADAALGSLHRAAQWGYGDADWMREDPDLEEIRDHPGFQELLRQLKQEGDQGI